ncbi:flagellar hook protein FlgE [Methylobacillus sp. MM3]|uniref:flagellar hook protein FlgE n=1 Tax=Methylobacillus sp. MM3 TaxID=1848039 RepID=UPI0007DE9577|nr:flagellar hook protein FlgE [Methylobacillus sp. MM3]OAJ71029.1 flagellar hook protein FlgE [Methylobacillus sp. MM3]
MGFQQGLSGLNTASKNLDVIGNNVANATTVGFKTGQAQFADVFAASLTGAGSSPVGLGSKLSTIVQQFTQGNITATNNPLDIAINGGGFFRLTDPSGTPYYSRNGQFQVDKNGQIVNSQGLRVTGYMADDAGTIVQGDLQEITIPISDIAPQETGTSASATGVEAELKLDSREDAIPVATAFDSTDPSTYNFSTSTSIYDSLGNASILTMFFRKTAANTWDVHTTVTPPSGTPIDITPATVPTIVFNSDGVIDAGLSTELTNGAFTQAITAAQLGTGASNMSFRVDFTGTKQWGGEATVIDLAQDGFASGSLTGFTISDDGILLGRYSNGQSKNLAQVVLANFRNPQGLEPQGNNLWADSAASGPAVLGVPQSGQFGALQSSAVEDSNVDLTAELVNMITAQRVYQANAQTIKTQDAVLQTLVNLR